MRERFVVFKIVCRKKRDYKLEAFFVRSERKSVPKKKTGYLKITKFN
jgi:hypothetical protein